MWLFLTPLIPFPTVEDGSAVRGCFPPVMGSWLVQATPGLLTWCVSLEVCI